MRFRIGNKRHGFGNSKEMPPSISLMVLLLKYQKEDVGFINLPSLIPSLFVSFSFSLSLTKKLI